MWHNSLPHRSADGEHGLGLSFMIRSEADWVEPADRRLRPAPSSAPTRRKPLRTFGTWHGMNSLKHLDPAQNSKKDRSEGGILSETVSHYRILRRLGSGGMGIVYEAEDTRLGRHVAVKLLPERFSKSMAAIERFQREACTASSLNHPNICTIHDVGEHAGRRFIVMELLEGETLRQAVQAGPLTPEQTIAFGIQIADGLEAAHKRGILHRDIKPANLFVIDAERIKILDFGLAKLTGRDRREQAPMEENADDA